MKEIKCDFNGINRGMRRRECREIVNEREKEDKVRRTEIVCVHVEGRSATHVYLTKYPDSTHQVFECSAISNKKKLISREYLHYYNICGGLLDDFRQPSVSVCLSVPRTFSALHTTRHRTRERRDKRMTTIKREKEM